MLAADLAKAATRDHLEIRDLEMLKGIRGGTNQDVHRVPVIRNTARERDLVAAGRGGLAATPGSRRVYAILVADHGAYIWGADVWETKRHAEVYHFLFEAVLARAGRSSHSTQEERSA